MGAVKMLTKPIDTQVGFGRHIFENHDDSHWDFSVPKQEKNYLMQTQEAMNNWFKQHHCHEDTTSDYCSLTNNSMSDSSYGLPRRSHSADIFQDNEDESHSYECRTAHSFAIHEDHLFEEMKQLAANHKIAQKNRPMSKKSATSASPQDKLFISNTLTIKFLEHGDTVLITVPEDWQITGCVDINLHLRVGKVLEKYNLDEECLIEVTSTEDNESVERVVIPSFCLCLEDKVLFERMKNKRNRIQQRRNSSENIDDTFINKDTISIRSTDSSSSSSSSSSKNSKPKRKQKSC